MTKHDLGDTQSRLRHLLSITAAIVLLCALQWTSAPVVAGSSSVAANADPVFTIAVIPDTQNMIDYRHQRGQDLGEYGEFPFDASAQFIGMLEYIAANSVGNGGNIVFATSVGDVWQHQSIQIDEDHRQRGFDFTRISPVALSGEIHFTEKTRDFEIPLAIEGYKALSAAGLPFAVAPGNHDYDAMWSDDSEHGNLFRAIFADKDERDPELLGVLHIGGLDNFRSAFGSDSSFFNNKEWYVAAHDGGTNSAQVFRAGGYTFLHIALEMSPSDEVLVWVQGVIDDHPGKPTIITTHDYLNAHGERRANPLVDLARLDPERHNSAEQLFARLIAPNDQVFLVLCGHHHGQAVRVDKNQAGNDVIQILADYQDRGQSLLDINPGIVDSYGGRIGLGDGWLRLMEFDLASDGPAIRVKTYSSHYQGFSSDFKEYGNWYKSKEMPGATEDEFFEADQFSVPLSGFHSRFSR